MSTELLEKAIAAKDSRAPMMARQLGPDADPVVQKALANPDWEVRDLAVECVYVMGGPERNRRLLKALRDNEINVSYSACRYLEETAERRDLADLLIEVKENGDAKVRGQLALVIGRLGDKSIAPDLRALSQDEPSEDVRNNLTLALARLGDEEARARVRAALESRYVETRLATVRNYEYISDPNALGDLIRVIDDNADALNIRPSNAPPYFLRVGDIVVQVVTAVGHPKLPFNGSENRRFSPDERKEVAKWLASRTK